MNNNPINATDPTGHSICGDKDKPCDPNRLKWYYGGNDNVGVIEILSAAGCFFIGCTVDAVEHSVNFYNPNLPMVGGVFFEGAPLVSGIDSEVVGPGNTELPNDATVYQYQKNFPKAGKDPKFNDLPREGEKALSCQYGPLCNNDPSQGLNNAFGREPLPGEYYRQTTIGDIRASGRTPVVDSGLIVDGRKMPEGHISIYGDNNPSLFQTIWKVFSFFMK